MSRVVKCSRLPAKIATYLVSIGRLLCLAFLFGWHFLNKISLDWSLTLTTQPSCSKLSDHPGWGSLIKDQSIFSWVIIWLLLVANLLDGVLIWLRENSFDVIVALRTYRAKYVKCFIVVVDKLWHQPYVSLRIKPFLLAPCCQERFTRRNVCGSATEIPYWWCKSIFT